jgi:hypothetical protein
MSRLYGTTLQVNPVHSASQGARQHVDSAGHSQRQVNNNQGSSWSWQERAALTPSQVMALTREQVLVSTLSDERYVFLGQRLNPVPLFGRLPPPARLRLPTPIYHERTYTSWQMDVSTQDEQIEEAGRHSESPSPAAVENDRDADASDSSKSRPGNAEGSVGDVI